VKKPTRRTTAVINEAGADQPQEVDKIAWRQRMRLRIVLLSESSVAQKLLDFFADTWGKRPSRGDQIEIGSRILTQLLRQPLRGIKTLGKTRLF
jgi:hypothetical protein